MREALEKIRSEALAAIAEARETSALEALRIRYSGKKGELTAILKTMGKLSAEERPKMGQLANEVRASLEAAFETRSKELAQRAMELRLQAEAVDVTVPAPEAPVGHLHPLTIVIREIRQIFEAMGFETGEGPEIETDYYNFEALNTPKNHPARDTQDTFYFSESMLLRTQTSSVQIRTMENRKPPIRMIAPGRVYRSDAVDATHSPLFHQIEGLLVDEGVTMADLKGALAVFAKGLFGEQTAVRFRPHHFPFTEPSAEMDVSCFACGGKGCRLCKGEGWIEILGCGMVHPNVLRGCGIDPEKYSGFAFGMGVERVALLRYKIDDMRLLYENDIRFLEQF